MKYYLSEFYKFKIPIAISIILGAIVVPTVLNNFLKPPFKDSFKVIMLNHETSLNYFLISNSLDSDIYTTELIIKPEASNPYAISTFTTLFFSDQQIKTLSKSIEVDELKLQKDINFFYRYPSHQEFIPVLQLILTGNLPEEDIKVILKEVKVMLFKLGLDESDYYFDNENLIEQGELGSLKNFQAQVQQSFSEKELQFSAKPNEILKERSECLLTNEDFHSNIMKKPTLTKYRNTASTNNSIGTITLPNASILNRFQVFTHS
jgi:hypothetical protein